MVTSIDANVVDNIHGIFILFPEGLMIEAPRNEVWRLDLPPPQLTRRFAGVS